MPKEKKPPPVVMAKEANKYLLYQEAVQSTKEEVKFMLRVYQLERSKRAVSLREDFCGTAFIAAEWAKSDYDRTAVGVDIDREQLLWGKESNVNVDPGTSERVKLICKSVLELDESGKDTGKSDVTCAFNFSICYLHERQELIKYFKICRGTLKSEGMFFCDIFGGEEMLQSNVRMLSNNVKYSFVAESYCPITNRAHFSMNFKFSDGSKIKDAFTYHFRIWTIPEIREALKEAGFARTVVWFHDESDDCPEEDYKPMEETFQRQSWHAFIVALV